MNKVFIIGNITQDLELKQTPTGKNVISFSVATNKKNKEGESLTEFHNCVAWNKTAELIEKFLTKGSKISIIGELQTRSWEAQDGTKRYKTEILVNEVEFLSSKNKEQEVDVEEKKSTKKSTPKKEEEINIEDIPF